MAVDFSLSNCDGFKFPEPQEWAVKVLHTTAMLNRAADASKGQLSKAVFSSTEKVYVVSDWYYVGNIVSGKICLNVMWRARSYRLMGGSPTTEGNAGYLLKSAAEISAAEVMSQATKQLQFKLAANSKASIAIMQNRGANQPSQYQTGQANGANQQSHYQTGQANGANQQNFYQTGQGNGQNSHTHYMTQVGANG